MRRKHFLILIYHSLYKVYRLINSIEIKTEFVKKIFIFETACYCSLTIIPRGVYVTENGVNSNGYLVL